jgi:undecaprenyl-diphosphatase
LHDYLLSVLLGIVEGLTEFLPVSSTAHLRVSEAVLGIDLSNGYWKMYSIVIQLGAILCLPIYFRSRISKSLATFRPNSVVVGILVLLFWLPFCLFCLPTWWAAIKRVAAPASVAAAANPENRKSLHPLILVLIAFVITAGPAWLLHKKIGENLERMSVIGWSLLVGGIIMWIVDARFGKPPAGGRFKTEHVEEMSLPQAVWIGICQIASAVFPGTSRSMSTIAAGQVVGMSRPSALEFSFFLSMPTMAAATFYELYKTLHAHHGETALGRMPVDAHEWLVLIIGFVISFFVAWAVVAWFMNWVRQRGFTPFAIYRIVLGIAVLVWVARSHGGLH